MSIYNPYQSTRIFAVTPAPSGQNTSREIWEGYLNQQIDEINIVDERTNLLIGTIGGSAYYKFNELPKSYVAQTIPNPNLQGDAFENNGGVYPLGTTRVFIRLNNGNLAFIDINTNSMDSEIFIYDAIDVETTDPNNGYWLAYKVSDTDPNVLEKIAETKMTSDYFNNGKSYTYVSDTECKFINYVQPLADNSALSSIVTTISITKTGSNYTLSASETTYNFGTTIALYNANAPVQVLPGAASWVFRSPYYSLQNYYSAIMKGVDTGWVWYGDGTSSSTLFTYMAGFNILTGQTAFIEPISSLAATTNFNPLGVVDATNFNPSLWESLPSGVVFFTFNKQAPLNGNNTNGILAMYSPRWENNGLVTFINQRNCGNQPDFSCLNYSPNSNSNYLSASWNFDSEYMYISGLNTSTAPGRGFTIVISRFKLDTKFKTQEIQNLPHATSQLNSGFISYYDIENGTIIFCRNPEWNDSAFNNPQFSENYLVYWLNKSNNANRLMSNAWGIDNLIGNKIYSIENGLFWNAFNLGIQYDVFNSVYKTLNS